MGDGKTSGETTLTPEHQVAIARLREELTDVHAELVARAELAATEAVVSARVPGLPLMLVTPDEIAEAGLGPESVVLCDFDGVAVADTPGADLPLPGLVAVHARLYRDRPHVGGVALVRRAGSSAPGVERVLSAIADAGPVELPHGGLLATAADARSAARSLHPAPPRDEEGA